MSRTDIPARECGPSKPRSRGRDTHRVPGRRPADTSRKIPVRPPRASGSWATSTVGLASGPPGGRRAASALNRATRSVCHRGAPRANRSPRAYRIAGATTPRRPARDPLRHERLPDSRELTPHREDHALATQIGVPETTARARRRRARVAPHMPRPRTRPSEVEGGALERMLRGATLPTPRGGRRPGHLMILVTWPAPTVRPPSRMANFRPSSMATGWISSTVMSVLSPGMTISVPSGRVTTPVTSVVRK